MKCQRNILIFSISSKDIPKNRGKKQMYKTNE